eukprot:15473666-Alexandrium_andersonii.AAC.1
MRDAFGQFQESARCNLPTALGASFGLSCLQRSSGHLKGVDTGCRSSGFASTRWEYPLVTGTVPALEFHRACTP